MRKRNYIFGIACVFAMTTALLTGCGCTDDTATPDEVAETSIQTVTEIVTDEEGNTYIEEATKVVDLKTDKKTDEKSEKSESSEKTEKSENAKKDSSSSKSNSSSSSKTSNGSKNNSSSSSSNKNTSSSKNNTSSSNKNTSSSSSSSSASKNEEPKHTHSWVNMTKQVKVVDQEAYTYEEPVYEKQGRYICNDCGGDITSLEERKKHMFWAAKKENGHYYGSYRSEMVKVQVGTKTVEVPEKSHYETEVIGRKCNSCGENEYY